MSACDTAIHLLTKIGIFAGGLFLVAVLLAAVPAHKLSASQNASSQESQSTQPAGNSMPGMDMHEEHSAEAGAVHDMTSGHDAHSLHMYMTSPRPQSPEDVQRANEVVAQLRSGIEKYRDYHAALDDGFKIFLPNIPQPEYHFTKMKNGFLEAFTFDAARPTSLLYKKTSTGYETGRCDVHHAETRFGR